LRLARLRSVGGVWVLHDRRWVGGAVPTVRTDAAPAITLDPTAPIGGRSQINVYALNPLPTEPDAPPFANTIKYREIADRSQNDGWRIRLMIDQWNNSQSATAAVRFGSSDAFALRWKFVDPRPNLLIVYRGTGVADAVLRDHDDVSYIANTGLAQSLRGLRCWMAATWGTNFEFTSSEC
jgi:hypothetical protein